MYFLIGYFKPPKDLLDFFHIFNNKHVLNTYYMSDYSAYVVDQAF